MELTIRDWMVIIGAILIVAVGIDAWRRVSRDRRSKVCMKLVEVGAEPNDRAADLAWLKELPNGGGRVVQRGDLVRAAARAAAGTDQEQAQRQAGRGPAQADAAAGAADGAAGADDEDLVAGVSTSGHDDEPGTLDWLEGVGAREPEAPAERESRPGPGKLPRDVDPEVFMLNVVARSPEGFRGEDILHILLACDLRFGDMSFFHRHEFEAGRGAIQFSVANMMQPGVFDIDNMADLNTPGLVFFLTLPGPEDMMKAFNYMLETAQAVARNLDGDVLDESRSVLTRQTLEHCRQQIRDLERRLLARAR